MIYVHSGNLENKKSVKMEIKYHSFSYPPKITLHSCAFPFAFFFLNVYEYIIPFAFNIITLYLEHFPMMLFMLYFIDYNTSIL